MKRLLSYFIGMAMFAVFGLGTAAAQTHSRAGTVVVPPTSVQRPQDLGKRAHTNFLIFVPAAKNGRKPTPQASSGPSGETPSSLACVYQIGGSSSPTRGCPVTSANYDNPNGGSKVIAIVDAYDYPTAASDFVTFSNQFGLPSGPHCGSGSADCFTKVYATGSKPSVDCGWAQEAALDIEWAHAMAPKAQIILVEAASNSFSDLLTAVDVASGLVANAGGGQVSMSWGGSEFRGESVYDTHFTTTTGVTYFASSGDSGGKVIWPSASPSVVSAGGTSVNRDSNGNFLSESAWSSAGGGASRNEPVPSYQSSIYTLSQLLGNQRGTPDISFDADPYTGVSVYDSTSCQGYVDWMVFGGTSVASPSLAGIFNLAGDFDGGWDGGTNSSSAQNHIYQNYSTASNGGQACSYQSPFYDVTAGKAGKYSATGCWDFASGIGTLRGTNGVAAGSTSTPTLSSLSLSSSSVTGGTSLTGNTVTLNGPAPSGGATISFTSSDPTVVPAPPGVTVSATNTSTSFTVDTNAVSSSTSVTITAKYNNSSAQATLKVDPPSTGGGTVTIVAPSSEAVPQNSSVSFSVSLDAGTSGFTGTVNLSVSGLPPQSSASSGSVSPGSPTTLTVYTGQHTPTKTYVLTISGTGSSGITIQPATVNLTVN